VDGFGEVSYGLVAGVVYVVCGWHAAAVASAGVEVGHGAVAGGLVAVRRHSEPGAAHAATSPAGGVHSQLPPSVMLMAVGMSVVVVVSWVVVVQVVSWPQLGQAAV
jgi:hypothetical protein